MDKIVCLIGESGSGKTTLCRLLEDKGYNVIKSFTNRKQRCADEYGHTFVGVVPEVLSQPVVDVEEAKKQGLIAYTVFDGGAYWATVNQYRGKGTSIYVIDVAGAKELKKIITDAEVVSIYLNVESDTRFVRMYHERGISSASSRIKHDRKVFNVVPCDYVINGDRNTDDIINDIVSVIGTYSK